MISSPPQIQARQILDIVYPIGIIQQFYDGTDPNNIMQGQVWEQITDTFLLASGTKSIGATGGEENHTLTSSEMPSHTHTQKAHNHRVYSGTGKASNSAGVGYEYVYYLGGPDNGTGGDGWYTKTGGAGNPLLEDTTATNNNTGGGGAHNNMPPYRVVGIWRRTA